MNGHDRPDDKSNERLAREAARMLRQSADELDAVTASRLNRARQQALAELDRRRARPIWQADWRPALGVAAAVVLAVALWLDRDASPDSGELVADPAPAIEAAPRDATDLDLLLAEESLEMLEDLEFYDWLATNGEAEDGPDPGRSG